ncbi:MAG: hypothetical protein JWM40_2623 [Frankiales bacterium]|nr:hypothetical protein [Frankiales bacterium]
MTTRPVGADHGLYGPGSVTWRVNADPSMLLAGLRALLLQTVHPLAMAGVAQHSDFQEDPWGRLFRTADYVRTTSFGTTSEARRAAATVRGIHNRLAGIEPESGRAYRVNDPALLLWVHCCQVESFLTTTTRCGLKLSATERDRYYAEQGRNAELIGASAAPASVAEMADYFHELRPELTVTASAREAARFVLFPPMPTKVQLSTPARPAWTLLASTAAAMLPRWCRRMYGMPGLPTTDIAATLAGKAIRSGMQVVPQSVVRRAEERGGTHRR